jgi:hypothetical protein
MKKKLSIFILSPSLSLSLLSSSYQLLPLCAHLFPIERCDEDQRFEYIPQSGKRRRKRRMEEREGGRRIPSE